MNTSKLDLNISLQQTIINLNHYALGSLNHQTVVHQYLGGFAHTLRSQAAMMHTLQYDARAIRAIEQAARKAERLDVRHQNSPTTLEAIAHRITREDIEGIRGSIQSALSIIEEK